MICRIFKTFSFDYKLQEEALKLSVLKPAFNQLSGPNRTAGLTEAAADQSRVFF